MKTHGRRTKNYKLGNGMILKADYWVTDVRTPIVGTTDLTASGLSSLFTDKIGPVFDSFGNCVQMQKRTGSALWYIQTFGRLPPTDVNAVTDTKPTEPKAAQVYNDRWTKTGNILTRVRVSAKKRLYVPKAEVIAGLLGTGESLSGSRKTAYTCASTVGEQTRVDNFMTARPADLALDNFWTGYTI